MRARFLALLQTGLWTVIWVWDTECDRPVLALFLNLLQANIIPELTTNCLKSFCFWTLRRGNFRWKNRKLRQQLYELGTCNLNNFLDAETHSDPLP